MKKCALIIGVEEYRDKKISKLQYASADARALSEKLKACCGFDQIRLLAGESGAEEPLMVNIITSLEDMAAELRQDDLFLFFFAGHGIEKDGHGYLLARDNLKAYPELGSLSIDVLRKNLERLAAGKRILLLDACRNSPDAGRGDAGNCMGDVISRDIVAAARSRQQARSTTAFLCACRPGQRAYEWNAKGHGVFTHYILEGLDGCAWEHGKLDFERLANYAARQVQEWSQRMPGLSIPQDPWYEKQGDPEPIILAEVAVKADSPKQHSDILVAPQAGRVRVLPVLHIESIPPGAVIMVDERFVGSAPCRATLEAGEHRVVAEKEGFRRWAEIVHHNGAGSASLRIEMEKISPIEAFFPMTEQQASEVQRAAAKVLGVPSDIELDCGFGIKMSMILIPSGIFLMGSPEYEEDRGDNEGPQHEVKISKPFYMGKYQVMQGEFRRIVGEDPFIHKGELNPAENITWSNANRFCEMLGLKNKRYIRLPTEAEWEYACRAGAPWRFFFGDDSRLLPRHAWYRVSSKRRPHPVGSMKPNALGLYDMHGNVWEWCADFLRTYKPGRCTDPVGTNAWQNLHVLRGGAFDSEHEHLRCAYRDCSGEGNDNSTHGFRCVCEL